MKDNWTNRENYKDFLNFCFFSGYPKGSLKKKKLKYIGLLPILGGGSTAGKRGAARQHCYQKEMDKNISGRRILVEFTTVFEFLKTKFLLLQL